MQAKWKNAYLEIKFGISVFMTGGYKNILGPWWLMLDSPIRQPGWKTNPVFELKNPMGHTNANQLSNPSHPCLIKGRTCILERDKNLLWASNVSIQTRSRNLMPSLLPHFWPYLEQWWWTYTILHNSNFCRSNNRRVHYTFLMAGYYKGIIAIIKMDSGFNCNMQLEFLSLFSNTVLRPIL